MKAKIVSIFACIFVSALCSASVTDFAATPPLLSNNTTPMLMLAMPNDHQLFYKAFTDWDDLDGDGMLEITYTHSIDYAGYFDSYKCYDYEKSIFVPKSVTPDKYCDARDGNGTWIQGQGEWSGNFLNWASMTRMDEVRKVLYGGYRTTDTSSTTVLERAFLPNDAHSFAKYYNGEDLYKLSDINPSLVDALDENKSSSGITICNTTDASTVSGELSNSSQVEDPPLMKIVKGNYSLWAAGERYQCRYAGDVSGSQGKNGNDSSGKIKAYSDSPLLERQVKKFNVRVEVCVPGLIGREDCKQYPNGNYKPVGLLQSFGDDDSIHFGLMTGSYSKNKSGGVLRKNVGSITDEINVSSNGTFTSKTGIIRTIDTFRIVGYDYSGGTYNIYDNCSWGRNSFGDGECKNWGNPFAEILLECYRYYGGASEENSFSASDANVLQGLGKESWVAPVTDANACANLNVLAFNASTISYDGDNLGGFADIIDTTDENAAKTAFDATNKVGVGEGIVGKDYFVGLAEGKGEGLCTSKQVNNLGSVEGTCSDAPRLQGTYKMAGIAHHAHVNDIAPDIEGDQNVTTYGITLSPGLPEVRIPVPGDSGRYVSILPACHNSSINGNCGLVDFKIVEPFSLDNSGAKGSGSFYVNWEDSEQGGDYDQDMVGVLSYSISASEIHVTTEVLGSSTPYKMGFGYVLGGTLSDGFKAHSGANGYSRQKCNNCKENDDASDESYSIGMSTASLLEQPLFYAAKWGGFVSDGSVDPVLDEPIPDKTAEWDAVINTTGAYGSDGIPDNYFYAVNPAKLKDQLESVVREILVRVASGTSASVVTSSGSGEGALYQALYNSRYDSDSAGGNSSITWTGTLHGLFIDKYGQLREDVVLDGQSIGQLTNDDPVVRIYFDAALGKTLIQRYGVDNSGRASDAFGGPVDVDEINSIWSARDALAALSNLTSNRNYSDEASGGRYIMTGLDRDKTGWVENDELVPFEAQTFRKTKQAGQNFRLLGFESNAKNSDITNMVNYIRGDESINDFRRRSIDYDGDETNGEEPWILGDIINSSPTVLTRPSQDYDIRFDDDSYRTFRDATAERRQVVFVGANDGMLHAFNGGFFDETSRSYTITDGSKTPHPLGSELWAYVPYNLLPHLNYLSDPDYPHVYYVDGEPQLFDVNGIWSSDSKITHPDGWGTILVVGMRFGGGEITVDPNSNADSNPSDDLTLRSSYLIFDVTDPEMPPELIGEINHPDMGYTSSIPSLVKHRASGTNGWYLAFGSGPTGTTADARKKALKQGVSDKTAKIFFYDLAGRTMDVLETNIANSFVGGITTADWNNDYIDDAIYFGTVGGDEQAPTGQLMRGVLNWGVSGKLVGAGPASFSSVIDVKSQAFSATPVTTHDQDGDFWLYAGTGRLFSPLDSLIGRTESYYGIKDGGIASLNGAASGTVKRASQLVDTTGIEVRSNGTVLRGGSNGAFTLNTGQEVDTYEDIVSAVADNRGWYFNLNAHSAFERNITNAVLSNESLVFTSYESTGLVCNPDGVGRLYAPNFQAGVPGPYAPLDEGVLDDTAIVQGSVEIGVGNPSAPALYRDGDDNNFAIVQTSMGEIFKQKIGTASATPTGDSGRQSWREILINW